jgi:hypothetical protein
MNSMTKRLLLLSDEIGDDAMRLVDALKTRGYLADPYLYLSDAANDLVRETPVVLLLAEDNDRLGFIGRSVDDLRRMISGLRVIHILLPGRTRQAGTGTVVQVLDFSFAEVDKVVSAIESNLRETTVDRPQPSIAIAWDPTILEPSEYAELVCAIGDIARAIGTPGIDRIQGQPLSRFVDVEART